MAKYIHKNKKDIAIDRIEKWNNRLIETIREMENGERSVEDGLHELRKTQWSIDEDLKRIEAFNKHNNI